MKPYPFPGPRSNYGAPNLIFLQKILLRELTDFIPIYSSYMVRPADIPEYLTHNVSKRHSPTVAPSVVSAWPLVLRAIIMSEMETAQVLVGLGGLVHRVSGHSVVKTKLNLCQLKKKSIFRCWKKKN